MPTCLCHYPCDLRVIIKERTAWEGNEQREKGVGEAVSPQSNDIGVRRGYRKEI